MEYHEERKAQFQEEHKAIFHETLKLLLYTTERYLRYCRVAVYRPSCWCTLVQMRVKKYKPFKKYYKKRICKILDGDERMHYEEYFRTDLGTLRINDLVGVPKDPNCWF